MKLLSKLLTGMFFWGTYVLPMYGFEQAFVILSVNTNDFGGIYRDGVLAFGLLAIIPMLLFLWLSTKWFHKRIYKIGIILFYLMFYGNACTSIAQDYRVAFGATWLWSEIFSELVKPQWYFYVFGTTGVFSNYQYLKLIQKKMAN